MPYPERLLSPGEAVQLEFRPHWQRIMVPTAITIVAIAALVAVTALLDEGAMWISLAVVALVWLITAVPRYLDWWFTRYIVTNERLIVRSGVLARRGKEIPLEVINDVAFSQSVLERLVHSGDLLIESAGEQGQSRFTDIPRPEDVQSQIYQLREKRTVALEGGNQGGAAGQLESLARLHRDGVLTDEEFAAKKQKLLDEI
ncbi:MAG: PH domain-containing protein [Acidimicrobiia bacterium]|nr:PH domain-containing protein [Acidimicrobiia bacterium]